MVGGGLIRSMGGWSAVFANRRRGEREVSDQRILGDGNFVKQVISGLDDLVKTNLRLSGQRVDIKALAEMILFLRSNPEKARNMAQTARNIALSDYSSTRMAR